MLEPQSIIAWIIIGAIAGWLAGLLVKGYGFGLIGNIIAGVVFMGFAYWQANGRNAAVAPAPVANPAAVPAE